MLLRRQLLLGFAALMISGCAGTKFVTDPILGPGHDVTNVFLKEATLPAQVRRVAVLPLTTDPGEPGNTSGVQTLEPVLRTELSKAGLFELVHVKAADLQKWSGKDRWDYTEVLPPDMLKIVAEQTDADAVLFPRLSRYHAYPPMIIGWRMTLIANDADVLWSVDEVFDAAEKTVSNSARRYSQAQVRNNPVLEDSRAILLTPSKFGQYTLDAIVKTLPKR